MKLPVTWGFVFLLLASSCFAASSERLVKEMGCNKEANGALHIIAEVRDGIPEEMWFKVYPIKEDFPDEVVAVIQKAVHDAYAFKGDNIAFMRKIYVECMQR